MKIYETSSLIKYSVKISINNIKEIPQDIS